MVRLIYTYTFTPRCTTPIPHPSHLYLDRSLSLCYTPRMAKPPVPPSSRERTIAALREPEFMDDLCEHISEGGTLLAFTKVSDLRYGMVHDWVTLDEARNARYSNAVRARDSNFRDRALDQIVAATGADIRHVFDAQGDVLSPNAIPDSVAPGVAAYEQVVSATGVTTYKVRMSDRTRNAELLGKTVAMFRDVTEVKGTLTLEEVLRQAKAHPLKVAA